jgi:hypothetical protein
MFPGTQIPASELKGKTTSAERMAQSYRNGHHATVYEVRKNPELMNTNVIRDLKELQRFPFVGGKSYKGQWKGDRKNGFGTEVNPDGTKYEGEWINNKRHGKGTIFKKSGKKLIRTYVGEWEAGFMCGSGTMYYANGEIYRGEWKKNKRSGKGRLDMNGGDYYEGDWLNDKKNGYGSLFLANGNSYEGLWMDDLKEGPGRFFYAATNKVYEGEWAEDAPRCGEYRQPSSDELSRFGEPSVRKQNFDLPDIGLEAAGEVLDMAVTTVRMENSDRRGIISNNNSGPVLSEENLEELRKIFSSLDTDRTSFVQLQNMGPFFGAVGFPSEIDETMINLFTELDLTLETEISFPESVYILQYMMNIF